MSDATYQSSDQVQTQTATQAGRLAAENMLNEVHAFQRHTDVAGQRCTTSPGAGEVPTLRPGESTNGCNFTDGRTGPGNNPPAEAPEFNTAALYQQALGENVRIDVRGHNGDPNRIEGATGSGVVIGRDGDRWVIATNAHISDPNFMRNITSRGVQMPDGRVYPAEVAIRDYENDRAALIVNTGRGTNSIARPASVAAESGEPGPGWTTGFPQDARSLYVSPTDIHGVDRSRQWHNGNLFRRRLPTVVETTAQTRQGNSGGPIYNERGEVTALVAVGPPPNDPESLRRSVGVPFNQELRDRWMEIIRRRRR